MSVAEITKQPIPATYADGVALQGAFCIDPTKVYHAAPNNTSADPFTSKTNKYAEAPCVTISTSVVCYIKWGTSAVTAADATAYRIPANVEPIPFVVHKDRPYLRVFAATTADVCVAELTNS